MGRRVDIPWVGDQNTMGMGSKYHEQGGRYTMGMWFDIPWVQNDVTAAIRKELSPLLVLLKSSCF